MIKKAYLRLFAGQDTSFFVVLVEIYAWRIYNKYNDIKGEVYMEQKVNLETWERKDIFQFFEPVSNPFYVVTFRQDVTKLYQYAKKNQISFYYALVYLCTKAMNRVPAFGYVIREKSVYRLEKRIPSFTDLRKGSEHFYIVTMECEGSMTDFCKAAKEKSKAQKYFIDASEEQDHLIYFSCLPWMDVTSVTHDRDLLAKNATDDSVPRITWGKYVTKENGKMELGMSMEVNHRLIDGVHIGRFVQELTKLIEQL